MKPDMCLIDAAPDHLPLVQQGLQTLSKELGDPYRITDDMLREALFGPYPACYAVLAVAPGNELSGIALYSPVVSTTTGGTGAYVSDLWVSRDARGRGLGQKLLARVAEQAHRRWRARFIRLVSYASNKSARAFYTRLGFSEKSDELVLQLADGAILNLRETT